MTGTLEAYLASDHERLEVLLNRATVDPDSVAMGPYEEFRKGLLRHIGIEEKIVLPAIARFQSGTQAADADRLRLDHGALVALMVPPPDASIVRTVRHILAIHNEREEGEGGIYRLLQRLAHEESGELLRTMLAFPEVPVHPHNPRPGVLEATRRAVARAGYAMES